MSVGSIRSVIFKIADTLVTSFDLQYPSQLDELRDHIIQSSSLALAGVVPTNENIKGIINEIAINVLDRFEIKDSTDYDFSRGIIIKVCLEIFQEFLKKEKIRLMEAEESLTNLTKDTEFINITGTDVSRGVASTNSVNIPPKTVTLDFNNHKNTNNNYDTNTNNTNTNNTNININNDNDTNNNNTNNTNNNSNTKTNTNSKNKVAFAIQMVQMITRFIGEIPDKPIVLNINLDPYDFGVSDEDQIAELQEGGFIHLGEPGHPVTKDHIKSFLVSIEQYINNGPWNNVCCADLVEQENGVIYFDEGQDDICYGSTDCYMYKFIW